MLIPGLELVNGTRIDARCVVVNADPFKLRDLAGQQHFSSDFNAWLDSLKKDGTTMKVSMTESAACSCDNSSGMMLLRHMWIPRCLRQHSINDWRILMYESMNRDSCMLHLVLATLLIEIKIFYGPESSCRLCHLKLLQLSRCRCHWQCMRLKLHIGGASESRTTRIEQDLQDTCHATHITELISTLFRKWRRLRTPASQSPPLKRRRLNGGLNLLQRDRE